MYAGLKLQDLASKMLVKKTKSEVVPATATTTSRPKVQKSWDEFNASRTKSKFTSAGAAAERASTPEQHLQAEKYHQKQVDAMRGPDSDSGLYRKHQEAAIEHGYAAKTGSASQSSSANKASASAHASQFGNFRRIGSAAIG
jgi:hypothetical protein